MKYEVTLQEIEIYSFNIEADSEKEAIDKACEIMDTPKKADHHFGSDGESTAYAID